MQEDKRLKNWENTKYSKIIRISEENWTYIKSIKRGRFSLSGTLDNIINNYKINVPLQKVPGKQLEN